jgi:hypothetical protein
MLENVRGANLLVVSSKIYGDQKHVDDLAKRNLERKQQLQLEEQRQLAERRRIEEEERQLAEERQRLECRKQLQLEKESHQQPTPSSFFSNDRLGIIILVNLVFCNRSK